jgi:predicted ester cyclase
VGGAAEDTAGLKGRFDTDPERNAATLQRLYGQVMNGHNVDAADELITIDRPGNDPAFPPEFTAGRAGFKKLMTLLIGAFPDLWFTAELIAAGNDLVSAFTKLSGTHQGEFTGIPAAGRSFLVNNADACPFTNDGLIYEHWGSSTPPRPPANSAPRVRRRPGDPGDRGDGPDRRLGGPPTRAAPSRVCRSTIASGRTGRISVGPGTFAVTTATFLPLYCGWLIGSVAAAFWLAVQRGR